MSKKRPSTINEHFKGVVKTNGTGRVRFIKKIRDSVYAEAWWFLYNIFVV